MIMRFDPFRELDRPQSPVWGNVPRNFSWVPMDGYRRGDKVVAEFDMPGIDLNSIQLWVENNVLTVRAERPHGLQEGDEVFVDERPRGTYSRQVWLGEGLDSERVQASYDRGVLTVTFPVAEAAKSRKIEVRIVSGAEQIEET